MRRASARPHAAGCARPHACAHVLRPSLARRLDRVMRRRPPVRTLAPAPYSFASTPYAPHVVVPAPATSNHSTL
ncbi:hypothetical protein GUJ93_ZPchr0014g46703 [Zizania palustris]|uniref:Uncharacterized protein n=1 Tax=Zizania palustris TaxID=103762 RepID=A0A8J5VV88_ZIZPA|nr:hypothetical protein GUJ93_ZPchr0014g46703 [Zizania palustris]